MDSLTQIVLGAAVGEAVLGRKIGNRAMVWGGIGGTIPDLDVLGNMFMDEASSLAFHRGISHSIFFSIVGAFLFGWLVWRFYKFKPEKANASLREWQWLFFGALFTHPILDSFTSYGTQLFAPFSDYRVAFSNISVADPLYTLPFLICLIVASFFNRESKKRWMWNYAGIAISSLYMLFTVTNKMRVTALFESNLKSQGIVTTKTSTIPTILNNVLWYCIAETDNGYVQGHYSFFDRSKNMKLEIIDKNHAVVNAKNDDRTMNILKWFTNGFYNIVPKRNGRLQVNDLRYGTFKTNGDNSEDNYVFRFEIEKQADGYYKMYKVDGGPKRGDEKEMLNTLWYRMKGI